MKNGSSTDWWTALYWWFLRLSTFNGTTIAVASLISACILALSIWWLIGGLPGSTRNKQLTYLFILSTPIYGGFAVNVSHDVLQVSASIILVGTQIRIIQRSPILWKKRIFLELSAAALLLTTQSGPAIICVYLIVLLFQRNVKLAVYIAVFSSATYLVSGIGVVDVKKWGPLLPVIGDLKCVAQHPEARISSEEWRILTKIAPRSEWTDATNCSLIDDQIATFKSTDFTSVNLDGELIKIFLTVTMKNPAIVATAHIERASQALPPPFFKGPKNQVDLNPEIPVGLNTNIALQSGTELLHPSIDEESVNLKIKIFKPLEFLAQGQIFLVNQASWFWGWGGFWLWPILIYLLKNLKIRKISEFFYVTSPIVTLHLFLIILISTPLGRYVMATIIIGLILLLNLVIEYLSPVKLSGNLK